MSDLFGAPLLHSRAAADTGRLLNALGVVASSKRAAAIHGARSLDHWAAAAVVTRRSSRNRGEILTGAMSPPS